MANKEFNTRISLKYDTYENWQTNNPVLLAGEVAITVVPAETGAVVSEPAVLFKVGDGTSTYSQLQFISALSADVYGWAKAANKPTYNASEIEGLSDFISGEINDTNTTYKIEQDSSDAHKLILYSKEAGSPTWNPVSTITTADTIYDDTELNNEIDALKDLIGETGVAAQIAAALGALDKSDVAVGGQFVTSVSQADGVVSVTRAALQASDIPALGADKITGLQTALDSKASADALSATDGKVTTLIGDDTAKSVRTIANEELAAQLIPEGAAESLNTLQEIAAWIQEHPDDASAMNSAITALQAQLTGIGSGSGTVKAYVDAAISAQAGALVYSGAGAHNSIYRGKNLGSSVTAEQYAAIAAGTFDDLYIGDYWTIGGVTYRIAAFDYYLQTGDTPCTDHHAVIVPDGGMYDAAMNDSDTTDGGYYGSKMHTSGLDTAKATILSAFGADHILTHRILLANAISNGASSGWAWYDSQIDLMNEHMVYGSYAWGGGAQNGYDIGIDKSQLALFQARPDLITNRDDWWLRDVRSATHFCFVTNYGCAASWGASSSIGVRPAFCIHG